MKSSRILIVGPLVSQHIQAWYSSFKLNAQVKVATVHNGGTALPAGFSKFSFQPTASRLDFFLFAPVFCLLWWWYRPTVTNFHYLSSYGLLSLLVPKKNLVLNVWGSDVNLNYNSKSRLKRYLLRKALRRFSWINAPAEHIKQKLIALGADADCIEVFQYGVDTHTLPQKAPTQTAKLTFVSNRNWQSLYRIPLIVEAFCLWSQANPNVAAELHVYGGGAAADTAAIEQVLTRYPAAQRSIVIKGYTAKADMLQQMSGADVFISIPERDGTPLSLLEAMYVGLLPLVSDIDANAEWLDSETAVWVGEYTPAAVALALQTSINQLAGISQWQATNRHKVCNNANLALNQQRFYRVLSQLSEAS